MLKQSMSPVCHSLESNRNYFNAQLEHLDLYLAIFSIHFIRITGLIELHLACLADANSVSDIFTRKILHLFSSN